MFTQCPRRPDAVAERTQIARRAALKGEPRQRPRNVRRAAKIVAQSSTQFVLSHKQGDRIEAQRNFRDIGQGEDNRLASSRAPADVRVRSIVSSRLPARWPESVSTSSRLRRVAASMLMRASIEDGEES